MPTRNQRPVPSPVVGNHSVTIPSVTVYFTPHDEPDGTFAQVPAFINEAGQKAYFKEGVRGNAFYDDGDVPEGYVLRTKDDRNAPNTTKLDFKVHGELKLNETTQDGGVVAEVTLPVSELSSGVKIALRNALKGLADEAAEIKPQ